MTASDAHFTFPSPVGELHFSMQLKRSLMIILGFRPLSGNYISQSVFMDLDRIARGRVSVPCRGTTFLNTYIVLSKTFLLYCFRPLSGNYISQCVKCHSASPHGHAVSVPCRGTTFLNSASCDCRWMAQSFRPLSGNYISQSLGCN